MNNKKPKRNDDKYKEIENFKDYELSNNIAYEMAKRNYKVVSTVLSHFVFISSLLASGYANLKRCNENERIGDNLHKNNMLLLYPSIYVLSLNPEEDDWVDDSEFLENFKSASDNYNKVEEFKEVIDATGFVGVLLRMK